MLDFSLGELAVVGVVALVVVGPEKLPKVARTAGLLFGRAQRMTASFRADLARELENTEIADLKQQIANEANNFKEEMTESVVAVSSPAWAETESSIASHMAATESEATLLEPVPLPEAMQKMQSSSQTTEAFLADGEGMR